MQTRKVLESLPTTNLSKNPYIEQLAYELGKLWEVCLARMSGNLAYLLAQAHMMPEGPWYRDYLGKT
jgi:hypothetical protein